MQPSLVLMPPPQHALSLALRGRDVRLARECRGDGSFPCTDEGHPLAAKDGFGDVAVAVVSTPALTTHPASDPLPNGLTLGGKQVQRNGVASVPAAQSSFNPPAPTIEQQTSTSASIRSPASRT
ncbi:MAG: hypothetical protein WCH32_12175 [Pseudomonadota bacterium]